jgi:hypothetical protein
MIAASFTAISSVGKTLKEAIQGWNRFWFSPRDPTLLGFMRICCGLVVLYIHIAYTQDLQELFGKNAWISVDSINEFRHDQPWLMMPWDWKQINQRIPATTVEEAQYMLKWYGVNPNLNYATGYPAWSIWFHVTDPTWMMVVHYSFLAIFFLFAIGFCTRVTSVLAWLAAISYIQRAPTSIFGLDTMMNILMIYLMIGPSGAALSVDRLISRWWTVRQARRNHLPIPARTPPAPRVSANLALRLLQIHFCIIYLASGLSKLQGNVWWNGTAVWGTMAVYEYCPMQIGTYDALLKFLCAHRWLWETVMTGGVAFTLFTEIGFPFLVWNRKMRWPMMTVALFLHTGIAMFMGLRTFSLVMLTMLCAFVPQETVERMRYRFQVWLGKLWPATRSPESPPVNGAVRTAGPRNQQKVSATT